MKDSQAVLVAVGLGALFVTGLAVPMVMGGHLRVTNGQQAAGPFFGGMMATQGQSIPIEQAVQMTKAVPLYADVEPGNNTITFSSKSVDLAVLSMGAGRAVNMTGRQPPAYSTGDVFVIYGLVNPTLVIPAGASLHVTVVNLDESEYHDFVVTTLAPPYPYMAMEGMMTAARQQLQGGSLGPMMPFLPPADYGRGVAHQYSYTFTLSTPSNLWYICMYPGHAQMGMYGEILVES